MTAADAAVFLWGMREESVIKELLPTLQGEGWDGGRVVETPIDDISSALPPP
jgi:hypothetical protein